MFVRDLYYSEQWQALEDKISSGFGTSQYVWSPVYMDALVLRDRDAADDSTLEERLYVQQDANWNVSAIINTSGTVLERYAYDPYGRFTDKEGIDTATLAGDWSERGASAYGWVYLHQGGRYDTTSNLYHFRNREYSSTLGRWMQVDPIRYEAGDTNLYRYVVNRPTTLTDPRGLKAAIFKKDYSCRVLCGIVYPRVDFGNCHGLCSCVFDDMKFDKYFRIRWNSCEMKCCNASCVLGCARPEAQPGAMMGCMQRCLRRRYGETVTCKCT